MDKIHARIQESVYTKAEWEAANPVLLKGEKGFVSDDPNLFKIGDGVTAWNSLPWRGYTGTIAQATGGNENAVMSQKATSEAILVNTLAINNEAQERTKADEELNTAIAVEKNRAMEAETALGNAINTEKERAEAAETALGNAINTEKERAEAAEQAIIFDVSAHNNDVVFESLQALLSSSDLNTLIPASVRQGGMTIRFIQGSEQSSDNMYVQYRLMSDEWSATKSNWQGVDEEPTAGSDNLIKSGGVYNNTYRIDNLEKAIQKENNLFDFYGDTEFLHTWIETDGVTRYADDYNTTDYLFVKGASKFISNTYIRRILFYNESQSVIQCINNGSAANIVVDIPANTVYMRLVITVTVWTSDVIVNIGNAVSTNKVPYKIGKNVDIEELDEFKQEYEGSKGYTPTLTYTPGFAYIVQSRIETDSPADHSISNVIPLAKGETIHAYLNAYGPSDVVSALCECDRSGNYVDNLVSAVGGNNYQTIEYLSLIHI